MIPFFLGFRLPVPRPGQVLGLVGTNGIGKSTALKVLAGKLKPNLGRFAVTWGGLGGWGGGWCFVDSSGWDGGVVGLG